MAITQLVIADDSRGLSTVLKPRPDGVVAFQGLDVQGAVREVMDDVPGQDGVNDQTQYASAAAVTLTLKYAGQFRAIKDEVDQYAVPWARPYLRVTDDEWGGEDRILRLRYSTGQAPLTTGTGLSRSAAYQWKAPAGVWENADATTVTVPVTAPPTDGLHVSATNGVDMPAGGVAMKASTTTGDTIVTVGGTMPPPWIARLYGPCTGPALYNDTTGQAIVFTSSLVLNAGEYVELNLANRTAYFMSDPTASRLLYLDWPNTTWFTLAGPSVKLRYSPLSIGRVASVPATSFGAYLSNSALGAADFTGALANWQALGGFPLTATRRYAGTTYSITTDMSEMIAAGLKICIDVTPAFNPVSSADYASISSLVSALLAAGANCEFALWHEPNLGGLTAAQYVAGVQYYASAIRPHYRLWSVFAGSDTVEANGYFPGASYVDGIAADCYGTDTSNLDNCAAMADNHGLPLALWEFNVAHDFGISPSPVTGKAVSDQQTFLTYVQNLFTGRVLAGKPVGDVLFFSDTGASTGTANVGGTALSAQGGFEGTLGTWVAGANCSVARSTAQAKSGTSSMLMTSTAAGSMSATWCGTALATLTANAKPITAGQVAAASAWFRAGSAGRVCHAFPGFYDATGASLTATLTEVTATDPTTGFVFASAYATAPANSAWLIMKTQVDATAAGGELHYVDDDEFGILPPTIDHTAPVQYPWDWRLPAVAAMRTALDGAGALAGGQPVATLTFTPRRMA